MTFLSQTLQMRPRHLVAGWATGSQLRARRNALVASTALAQRRSEAAEVEEFLATRSGLPARTG
ncbi:hypothetical protein [Nocardioides donggukensis]|uniref:Uncharacterized protein n=1 Tax=Nocardioides donggukensis TaxID=2774019 RepID=A0A927K4K2_9ACTN|nr:hypothetical protein [Nocardioides donggukensis]MBD8868955.1 hypothetical protein [Nocardioides donggukensis]